MATAVVMPKQGQSVESCIIVTWKVNINDRIAAGDVICEVETDKAALEVESTAFGTVLALFFKEGDEVPVLTNIVAIGEPGEDVTDLWPSSATAVSLATEVPAASKQQPQPVAVPLIEAVAVSTVSPTLPAATPANAKTAVSPRARNLARRKSVEITDIQGSGPGGRIIERDVETALAKHPPLTSLAKSMVDRSGFDIPKQGSGVRGRITAKDLKPVVPAPTALEVPLPAAGEVEIIPVKGIRKVIAKRMLNSLQTTAQLTLNSSADATALLAFRKRLKNSAEEFGLQRVTINDLILLAVSRMLTQHPDLNALFENNTISRYKNVHLAFAVDTPRGLVVPVIHKAHTLSLKQISQQSGRLTAACLEGNIAPDEITGGTFTVTNLGSLGIESFTPVLNPPQVGILGVGNVNLKPVEIEGEVQFMPHIGLSLTINHQVVDGVPAARFLQSLSKSIAEIELLPAL